MADKVNKTQWILKQDRNMKAADLVKLAKGAGITLTTAQIYTARSVAAKKGGAPLARKSAIKMSAVGGRATPDLRTQFLQLAVRIGTDAAQFELDRLAKGEARV